MDEVVGGLLLGLGAMVGIVGGLILGCRVWSSELVQDVDWGEGYTLLLRRVIVEWVGRLGSVRFV